MNFEDIRPYDDSEVYPAVQRLLADDEFISSMGKFRFPGIPLAVRKIIKPFISYALKKELGGLSTVRDIQTTCEGYLEKIITRTTTEFSYSGLENLSKDKAYLFISNHRDIVMDPAFVNYALYHSGMDTVRIAIGDNLLQKPFVSDLMRLNKSFIVKRSATGVRGKMAAYTSLSSYIHHSVEEGCSIWIAQREGRAKNGVDQTDPAIIKMLYMSQKQHAKNFSDYINWLSIVPVTISYEYNPCDRLIASELYQKQQNGKYEKAPGEDIRSIVMGITGQKGKVHVAFGDRLKGDFQVPEDVAQAIDRQMLLNYRLQPSAYIAAKTLLNSALQADAAPAQQITKEKEQEFLTRLVETDQGRQQMLELYANPLFRKYGIKSPTKDLPAS